MSFLTILVLMVRFIDGEILSHKVVSTTPIYSLQ